MKSEDEDGVKLFNRTIGYCEKSMSQYSYMPNLYIKYIYIVLNYIKQMHKEYPDLSAKELKILFHKNISTKIYDYTESADCGTYVIQSILGRSFLDDEEYLKQEYEKIKDMKLEPSDMNEVYDKSFEEARKSYVKDSLLILRDRSKEITPEMIDLYNTYDKVSKNRELHINNNIKDSLDSLGVFIDKNDEYQRLKKFIGMTSDYIEEILKEKYVGLMKKTGDFLASFNLLNNYSEINRIELRKFDIEELFCTEKKDDKATYIQELKKSLMNKRSNKTLKEIDKIDKFVKEISEDYDKKDDSFVSIRDIFSEDFLKKQSLEELSILNIFWQNRFAKETKSMNEVIFYVDTANVWEDVVNDKEVTILDDNQIDSIVLKTRFLEKIASKVLMEKDNAEITPINEDGTRVLYDATQIVRDYENKIGKQYKEYFDQKLPNSENDFFTDISDIITLYSNQNNVYYTKDKMLINLMYTFLNSKKIKNWGYIQGNNSGEFFEDKRYVLLGIDYEGFNMPLRVHMKKDDVIDSLKEFTGKPIIPLYEGENDFVRNGRTMKTHLFMPLDKIHKKVIRFMNSNTNETASNYRLTKHMNFLRKSDEFPEHLKQDLGGKNGKRRVRKYIDVETGQFYTMDKKNYIPIDNGGYKTYGNGDSER